MRILITGASGFIGKHLVSYFNSKKISVVALCRSGQMEIEYGDVFKWQLGEPIPESALVGVTHVIHLAHDFAGASGAEKTMMAVIHDCKFFKDHGVTKQLFFSSYSAGEHANSLYGLTKFKIETAVKFVDGAVIVRPGLVLGDSGIFGRISKIAEKYPLLPLPDGGKGMVPIIEINKLCEVTYCILNSSTHRDENIFEKELVSLRDLVLRTAIGSNNKPIILNIPSKLVLFMLKVFEFLHVPLPVNADNLSGFIANQKSVHRSTLKS